MYFLIVFVTIAIVGGFLGSTAGLVFGIIFSILALGANITLRVISIVQYGEIKASIEGTSMYSHRDSTLYAYETAANHWISRQFIMPLPNDLKEYIEDRRVQREQGQDD